MFEGHQIIPQTQGKIERWHQTLKTASCWRTTTCQARLKKRSLAFVDHYNNRRYHESLGNLTPADVYFGRSDSILKERRKTKERTLKQRRLLNLGRAA